MPQVISAFVRLNSLASDDTIIETVKKSNASLWPEASSAPPQRTESRGKKAKTYHVHPPNAMKKNCHWRAFRSRRTDIGFGGMPPGGFNELMRVAIYLLALIRGMASILGCSVSEKRSEERNKETKGRRRTRKITDRIKTAICSPLNTFFHARNREDFGR